MLTRLWVKALFMFVLLAGLVFLPGAACGDSTPSSGVAPTTRSVIAKSSTPVAGKPTTAQVNTVKSSTPVATLGPIKTAVSRITQEPTKSPTPSLIPTDGPSPTPSLTPTEDKSVALRKLARAARVSEAQELDVTIELTLDSDGTGDWLVVHTVQSEFWDESSWLPTACYAIRRTTPLLFEADPELGYVKYEFLLPGYDAKGNSVSLTAMTAVVSRETYTKIDWDSVDYCDFPSLLDSFGMPPGFRVIFNQDCGI